MPIVNGFVTEHGAIIDLMVGVGQKRRALLERAGRPVPQPVHVRAQIDTGAHLTGIAHRVFADLGLLPVGRIAVLTPSTPVDAPHEADIYDVSLYVVANGQLNRVPAARVMAADGWSPDEGMEALIGRDILDRCYFTYHGPDRYFTLNF